MLRNRIVDTEISLCIKSISSTYVIDSLLWVWYEQNYYHVQTLARAKHAESRAQ